MARPDISTFFLKNVINLSEIQITEGEREKKREGREKEKGQSESPFSKSFAIYWGTRFMSHQKDRESTRSRNYGNSVRERERDTHTETERDRQTKTY